MRLYHVIAINERKGWKVYLTDNPLPHEHACELMRRFNHHPARRIQLEQV